MCSYTYLGSPVNAEGLADDAVKLRSNDND